MIVIAVLIVCAALLLAQYSSQEHEQAMQAGFSRLDKIETRLSEIERRKPEQFDSAAFDDIKNKVETLRIAQGLKGSR